MICCDAPVLRRLLTTVLGAVLGLLVVAGPAAPQATAAPSAPRVAATGTGAPDCPEVTVGDSTRRALAVFTGTVSAVEKLETGGPPGAATFLQTVTVDLVYQGRIRTETVQVQTERLRGTCSLGALVVGTEYMFFVDGTGEPWEAQASGGTRPNTETVAGEVEALLGAGEPPIEPTPEKAVFTPVDTDEPQTLARAAAPGAAFVIVGLLGLVTVGALRRRG